MQRVGGSNLVMRDAGAQPRSPLRASEPRLRRRPIGRASEQACGESAARKAPDITHRIGFGILLIAALLIAIGSFGAPKRWGSASSGAQANSVIAADTHDQGR
jgi:hypothetical protein